MHLEQNSETMNLEQNNSNVYLSFQRALIVCKRIPGLTDVTQPNCDFVLWYIRVGSCHCPVLIRTHINTNLFLCLCVYTVCVIFACLIQPLEPIFVCVCVCWSSWGSSSGEKLPPCGFYLTDSLLLQSLKSALLWLLMKEWWWNTESKYCFKQNCSMLRGENLDCKLSGFSLGNTPLTI